MDFTDKKVLVTGGTRGVGAAAVRTFLERGARVAVTGRSSESVAKAIDEFGGGDRLIPAPGDIGTVDDYFPDGLPTCPVDGTSYTLDATTHFLVGHDHN